MFPFAAIVVCCWTSIKRVIKPNGSVVSCAMRCQGSILRGNSAEE